ncbi:MAG TPA: hypothetical protein PLC14_17695 [Accumulibacter sp.]|uniref:hypothetical protein n=1 Tax=Accumulibacter sp. TaxID=2053492 RepID=UPI002CB06F0E|nr:hypothetical protein [Accumulibacter sp.]HRE72339.1 hypothetical protein [Accumulibacter sp.]
MRSWRGWSWGDGIFGGSGLQPQNPDQCFCSADACQRERRRRWQAAKRQSDPDYRENQKRAQKGWAERHPDYWRAYREQHPEYVARNRARQRERALDPAGVAKMDAWMVEITVISAACASP